MGLSRFTDWRLVAGAHIDRRLLPVLVAAALAAVILSAWSVMRGRPRRRWWGGVGLVVLRTLAVATCLCVALEPTLELRQVTHIPNHVAVLVDASRSMTVAPPDGGRARHQRAADLIKNAAPQFARWAAEGHRVDLYTFGEALAPTSADALRAAPTGEATRIGEALSELRARYAGRDLGAVVIVSDGIDTGRVGRGALDGETLAALKALGAPVHGVLIDEPSIRDLSIAAVLADDFAFVRTPITLDALVRQSGLPNRQIEVTLSKDGRLVDSKAVLLEGPHSETKVSFSFTPDQPGNFVFEIATPVLAGEALTTNNRQVFTLKVIRDRIRVLHVCGRPSWDERFMRSLLRLNPNVDLVSFFILRTETDEAPLSHNDLSLIPFPDKEVFEDQLHSFDLLVFQNFNYRPYNVGPYLPGVRDYVEGGGALVMIGGDLSFASGFYGESPLRDVLPVELDGVPETGDRAFGTERFKPKLTAEGLGHPITALSLEPKANETRWSGLPPLEGWNRVAGLRTGASALLVHPTQKSADGKLAPVVAVTDAGKGRTMAVLTDTTWHWGFQAAGAGDDGRAFQRFWESAIRWLVRDPALTLLRIDLDRVEYRRGQNVTARVRALHPDYTPAEGVAITVALQPVSTTGDAVSTKDGTTANNDTNKNAANDNGERTATTNHDGEAHLVWPSPAPGAYRLAGHAVIDGRSQKEDKTFVVRAEGRELEDVVARDNVLAALAAASGGEVTHGQFSDFALRTLREERVGSQKTIELWSNPALLALALLFLLAEWVLRRRAGNV